MPPPPTAAAPARRRAAMPGAALLALLAAACGGPRAERFEDVAGAEGLVQVLPSGAHLEVDGVPLGPGSRAVPVRDPTRVHRVRASAAGFQPHEVEVPAQELAGGRVGLALRPEGFGSARTLSYDEPSGLSAAAALLLRAGRSQDALEYAQRAAELAPDAAPPRRVLGDAWLRLGRPERAIPEYSAYLAAAPPDAPDRREVEDRLSRLRGDIALPGSAR
jgi:tetratricopeptide (TPR) repeat protein